MFLTASSYNTCPQTGFYRFVSGDEIKVQIATADPVSSPLVIRDKDLNIVHTYSNTVRTWLAGLLSIDLTLVSLSTGMYCFTIGSVQFNWFQVVDEKFTCLIKFTDNTGFYNKIRLPVSAQFPQQKFRGNVFETTQGLNVNTKKQLLLEYKLNTDYMPISFHTDLNEGLNADDCVISIGDGLGYRRFIYNNEYETEFKEEINYTELTKAVIKIKTASRSDADLLPNVSSLTAIYLYYS